MYFVNTLSYMTVAQFEVFIAIIGVVVSCRSSCCSVMTVTEVTICIV